MKLKKPRLRAWLFSAQKKLTLFCTVLGVLSITGSAVAAQTRAVFVVQSDRGGWIVQRSKKIRDLSATGQRVELRGSCLSACTMYLSLPSACISPSATFGFHGPTRNGQQLSKREFDYFSRILADNYKEPLRSWFMTEARYRTVGYYKFTGAQLISMGYSRC